MERLRAMLRDPTRLIKLLLMVGAVAVAYALLSSTSAPPKPWEDTEPAYRVGEMADFERSFPSQPLPNVTLMKEGERVALQGLSAGRPLVVNLWATWCAPCLEELPSLDALQAELGEEADVVAVALEAGDGSRQQRFFDRLGIENLTLYQDPKLALGRAYSDDLTLPLTVIYDGRGREIGRVSGSADWAAPESVRLVRAVASGKVPR